MGECLLNNIPLVITDQQNTLLCAFPSMDEIDTMIKEMNMDCAAGPNGYNGFFILLTRKL